MYTLISMMNKAMIILNKYITKAYAACMYVCMYTHTNSRILEISTVITRTIIQTNRYKHT